MTLRGNVAQPGRYVWKEGMRISDLIPSRDFLITRDFWNRQNQPAPRNTDHPFGTQLAGPSGYQQTDGNRRTDQSGNQHSNQSNRLDSHPADQYGDQGMDQYGNHRMDQYGNQPRDQFEDQSTDQPSIQPSDHLEDQPTGDPGDQRNDMSGASDRSANSRTTMIATVGQNNAEINWEYAVIERLDEHDLSTRLIPFRLVNAIDNRASPDNQLLRAGDVVTIFSRADLDLPMEKHASFVRVGGEVNAPGVYRVNPGETLRDVVEAAGGLTPTPISMPLSLPAFPPVMRKRRNCGRPPSRCKENSSPAMRMLHPPPVKPGRTNKHSLLFSRPPWRGSLRSSQRAGWFWK